MVNMHSFTQGCTKFECDCKKGEKEESTEATLCLACCFFGLLWPVAGGHKRKPRLSQKAKYYMSSGYAASLKQRVINLTINNLA